MPRRRPYPGRNAGLAAAVALRNAGLAAAVALGLAFPARTAAAQALPHAPFLGLETTLRGRANPLEAPVRVADNAPVDITRLSADVTPIDARGALDVSLFLELTVRSDSLRRLALPARNLVVRAVHVIAPGQPGEAGAQDRLSFLAVDDSLIVFLEPVPLAGRFTLRVDYEAPEGTVVRSTLLPEGGCCAWTPTIRAGGDPWLPVAVDPSDRFPAEIRVRPRGLLQLVSGGRRDRTRPAFRFDRPVRADQLVLAVAAGEPLVRSARRREIAYYGTPGDRLQALDLFHRDFDAALEFVDRATGFTLPYDTIRVVFGPTATDGLAGAGIIVANPMLLADTRDRMSVDPTASVGLLAARLWSDGLLAPSSWTDVWLTEALAHWLAASFVENRRGAGEASAMRLAWTRAYLAESESYRRPLVWDRWEHPADLVDAHAAGRGAGFLYMLQGLLGDGPFRSGIRRLFASSADVDTESLRAALEGTTGRRLSAVFDAWVYAAGHPVLDLSTRFDLATDRLDVTLSQVQEGDLVPSAFPIETDLRWMTLGDDGSAPVVTDEAQWTLSTVTGIEPRFVVLDADRRLVSEIRDRPDLASLTSLVRYGTLPTRLSAAETMVRFAEDPALPLAIRLALDGESEPVVRRRLAALASRIPPGGSLEGLIRRAWSDSDAGVRAEAVRGAAAFAGRPEWETFVRDEATRDSAAVVLAAAVETLAAMGSSDATFIARSAIITPSHGEIVRRAGFGVLASDSTLTPFERRRTILEHTAPGLATEHIVAALQLAGRHGPDRELRTRMLDLLDHPSYRVRAAAATAAGRLLTARDALQLDRILESERDPAVRSRLRETLRRLRTG